MGRSIRRRIPNSVNPEDNTEAMIHKGINKHEDRIKDKNKTNKKTGDRVRIQDILTKEFDLFGTVESHRVADNGKILSYTITTDKEYQTTRHRRYLRPLAASHDPEIPQNIECIDKK